MTAQTTPVCSNTTVPRFCCPFRECDRRPWAASSSLFRHVENLHLSKGDAISSEFLDSCDKRVCFHYKLLTHVTGACRGCSRFQAPVRPPPQPQHPVSLQATLQLLKGPPRTLHHIPKGCQELLAGLTADLAQEAAGARTLEAVSRLMLMPRAVLAPLMRSGARHEQKATKVIRERVVSFRAGILEPESVQPTNNRGRGGQRSGIATGSLSETTQRLVTNAIRERALGNACRLLESADLPRVEDAEQKLRILHPLGPESVQVDEACKIGSFDFSAEQVYASISSFPPGSGADPHRG